MGTCVDEVDVRKEVVDDERTLPSSIIYIDSFFVSSSPSPCVVGNSDVSKDATVVTRFKIVDDDC